MTRTLRAITVWLSLTLLSLWLPSGGGPRLNGMAYAGPTAAHQDPPDAPSGSVHAPQTDADAPWDDAAQRHHVIIAIDKAGCSPWTGNAYVAYLVGQRLKQPVPGDADRSRPLYQTGDYLSLLGFAMDARQDDMHTYALPIDVGGTPCRYRQFTSDEIRRKFAPTTWHDIAGAPLPDGGALFSLVSVAKPYALLALPAPGYLTNAHTPATGQKATPEAAEQRPPACVGRTLLLLITDHHYNGNDFYDEIHFLNERQRQERVRRPLDAEAIFRKCYKVDQQYYIRHLSTDTVPSTLSANVHGYVECYEYVPMQQNFQLATALSYPTHVTARRLASGGYAIDMRLTWLNNPQYGLLRLDVGQASMVAPGQTAGPQHSDVSPIAGTSVVSDTPATDRPATDTCLTQPPAHSLTHLSDTVLSLVVGDDGLRPSQVTLRAWLRLDDGFYGATIMSPDGLREAGREGLTVSLPIDYEAPSTIFGLPLPLWAWRPLAALGCSQATAAWIWMAAISLLALYLLLRYATRPLRYHPGPADCTWHYGWPKNK